MWVLVTIHASITWAKLDDTYIQHGETRETQLSSLPLFRVEHLAVVVIDAVVILISLLLADMTMVSVCRLRRPIHLSEPLIRFGDAGCYMAIDGRSLPFLAYLS